MKIRTGGPDDADDILALLDSAVTWLAARGRTGQWGDQPWSTRPAAVDRVHGYTRDYLVRIAEDEDGRTVGCAVLAEELAGPYIPPADEPELYLRNLVTDRARKGSGIGAALIADAVEQTRRRGHGLLRVDCYAGDDRRLVEQYRRLGFTPTETFTVDRPGDTPWPGQILEIRL
jgi:GNAT superfamily N-acetyltransferase